MAGIVDSLTTLLTEIPVSAVLRERVELLLDQLRALEKRQGTLEEQLAATRQELADCRRLLSEAQTELASQHAQQAAELQKAELYVEHEGVLWKKDGRGGYAPLPCCPVCLRTMTALAEPFPFECRPCDRESNFQKFELTRVQKSLPAYGV